MLKKKKGSRSIAWRMRMLLEKELVGLKRLRKVSSGIMVEEGRSRGVI